MFDFSTSAPRSVNDTARTKRLAAAQELVQRTLAQHGLGSSPNLSSPANVEGLGDLMQSLLAKCPGLHQPSTSVDLNVPDGAQFLSDMHEDRTGRRPYRTYVPAGAEQHATGIVMMLHGCTQTPEDFAIGTGMNALADKHGFIILYPEQSRGANAQTCWNWFNPNDQQRNRGEPGILAGIARKAMDRYDVAPDRTCVAGLSAGGAMAVILGQTHPDVFTATGAHSGLPYRAATNVASAFAAMAGTPRPETVHPTQPSTRTIVFHGAADKTVHPSNGAQIVCDAERQGPAQSVQTTSKARTSGRTHTTTIVTGPDGRDHLEHWVVEGLGHAWSGGQLGGSYTDPKGPDASAEMIRFFFNFRN